ncbi:MAG: rRNA pseudouridine synthase [bacterium]|nr:rRNA pseudouridine synthase [bacterium]
MTEALRLSKRITEQFNCSRREAELLIEGGWVMVDGEVVEEPQFMVQEQTLTLHPDATVEPSPPATLLLHKPAGYDSGAGSKPALALITAASHIADDPARIRLLKKHFARLNPVLPLEAAASGLLVFTQDYRVARKLIDDAYKIEQEFIVEVSGTIAPDGLKMLNHGLDFEGMVLPPIKVSWQNETRLRFALKTPRPGQIVAMCSRVGLVVVSMKRIRIGRISMGSLQPGQWRYLPHHEKF